MYQDILNLYCYKFSKIKDSYKPMYGVKDDYAKNIQIM